MNRIVANLAPLLTCPALMLWHLVGAVIWVPAFLYTWSWANPEVGGYVATFALPAWSACILTSLQKDILHKPFSFVLPGHRGVQRRTALLVGIAVSFVAALPILSFPGLGGQDLLWAVWSAFCFGLIVYLLVMALQMSMDAAVASPTFFGITITVVILFPGALVLVQDVALFAPGWNSGVLAALSIIAWRQLGSVKLARGVCGKRFLSLQMSWRASAARKFSASGRREGLSKDSFGLRDRLLRRCFARISRRPELSCRRHLAAEQYQLAGYLIMPLRLWSIPIIALISLAPLVFFGYAGSNKILAPMANMLYFGSCVIGMHLAIPRFNSMLLPAGRGERFISALAFSACGGLIVLTCSLLTFILLQGMSPFAPQLSWGGVVRDFRPADLGPALVPVVYLPLSMILKITCTKWLMIPEMLLLFIAGIFIFNVSTAFVGLSPVTAAALLTVSWALLVGVIYSYSFSRDLVPA